MKKNDIIEIDGKEYTVELNRKSFIAIDKYSNIKKSATKITENLYDYVDEMEISDQENPFEDLPSIEESFNEIDEKMLILKKMYTRAFWIWLYPNHKFAIEEVENLLESYFDDDDKFEYLSEKYSEFLEESIKIKTEAEQELKNLKAQANK